MHFSAKRGIAIACRLSIRSPICDVGGFWSHRLNSSTIISPSVSLACSLFAFKNTTCLLQGEHPEIFARIGVGCVKSDFRRTNAVITLKRGKIGPRLLLKSNRKSYMCLRLVPWPWMTLKGHYALCFKTRTSFGAHCENLNEDRPVFSEAKL